MILSGILYTHDIPYAFHNTDGPMVTGIVRTDRADIIIGNHTALTAVFHIIAQTDYSLSEMMHILLRLLEKMQGKAQSTSASHTRQRTDRIHCLFKKF
jgi:hypothetical protein